jgi:hypothetical protein
VRSCGTHWAIVSGASTPNNTVEPIQMFFFPSVFSAQANDVGCCSLQFSLGLFPLHAI